MGLSCCTARASARGTAKVTGSLRDNLQDSVQDNILSYDDTMQNEKQGNYNAGKNGGGEKDIVLLTDHPNCSRPHDTMQDDEQGNYNVGNEQGNYNSSDKQAISDYPNSVGGADDGKNSTHDDKDFGLDKGEVASSLV